MTSLSRFQLLSAPMAAPGKCVSCGAGGVPVVDFGMSLEFYGAVYFCADCLTEIARTIDMRPGRDFDILSEKFETQLEHHLEQRDLRIVSNEWYHLVADIVGSLSTAFAAALLSGDTKDVGSSGDEIPPVDESEQGPAEPVQDTAGQDDNDAGDKGPARVSASAKRKSGPAPFEL